VGIMDFVGAVGLADFSEWGSRLLHPSFQCSTFGGFTPGHLHEMTGMSGITMNRDRGLGVARAQGPTMTFTAVKSTFPGV
jgi:hypothetical protein